MSQDRITFNDIRRTITISMNVDSLSDRDRISLLYHLLVGCEVAVGAPGYEEYQLAAGVILNEANKRWK